MEPLEPLDKLLEKQEAHLSEGRIFAYQQPHYRINKSQQWYRKASSKSFYTKAINVKYIDREEDNTYSL